MIHRQPCLTPRALHRLTLSAVVLLLMFSPALPVRGQQEADLAAENARLRAQVAELETELQRLQAENRRLAELAGLVPEEEMVEVETANIVTATDPQTGLTTTTTRWVELPIIAGDRSAHHMMVRQGEDGQAMLKVATHFSRRIYQGLANVTFVIDGSEVVRPVIEYGAARRGSGGLRAGSLTDETLTIDLGQDLLARLAGARAVELQMRHVRAELGREQLAQFKALAVRHPDMTPSSGTNP